MPNQIVFALILSLLLTSCTTYDYAVDKSNTKLPYRTYYYGDKDKQYDFYTVLYSQAGDIGTSINYTDFNVHIGHMLYERQNSDKGMYVSEIIFDNKNKLEVVIDYESLKLVHTNINGSIIKPVRIESGKNDRNKFRNRYKLIYKPKDISDSVEESIYVKMTINDREVIIKNVFKIEKMPHYTFWDVLMGV